MVIDIERSTPALNNPLSISLSIFNINLSIYLFIYLTMPSVGIFVAKYLA